MTNRLDPLQTAKSKKQINTTMYEVNDKGREHEYHGSGYSQSFIEFIESLGFDIVRKYEHSDTVLINGRQYDINTDNASFMSRNAFTRDSNPRKQQNRWVGLCRHSYTNPPFVKVYINKEMDSDKIKAKINAAIAEDDQRDKDRADRKQQDYKNTLTIGHHFFDQPGVAGAIKWLHIEKGVFTFYFHTGVRVMLKSNNEFISVDFDFGEVTDHAKVYEFVDGVAKAAASFEDVFSELVLTKVLPADLIEWAGQQYHTYFYTETMDTEPSKS